MGVPPSIKPSSTTTSSGTTTTTPISKGKETLENLLESIGWIPGHALFSSELPADKEHWKLKKKFKEDELTIYYPGAGSDRSILQFLAKYEREVGEGLTLVLQDTTYTLDPASFGDLDADQIEYFTFENQMYMSDMQKIGATIIAGDVQGDELPEGADIVYMANLTELLTINDMAGNILKNTKKESLIVAPDFDIAMLTLLYDGLDILNPTLVEVKESCEPRDFHDHYDEFPHTIQHVLDTLDGSKYSLHDYLRWPHKRMVEELSKATAHEVKTIEKYVTSVAPDYMRLTFHEAYAHCEE